MADFLLHSQHLQLLPHTTGAHGPPKATAPAQLPGMSKPPHELQVSQQTKGLI